MMGERWQFRPGGAQKTPARALVSRQCRLSLVLTKIIPQGPANLVLAQKDDLGPAVLHC